MTTPYVSTPTHVVIQDAASYLGVEDAMFQSDGFLQPTPVASIQPHNNYGQSG
jgi:hypothetical protein